MQFHLLLRRAFSLVVVAFSFLFLELFFLMFFLLLVLLSYGGKDWNIECSFIIFISIFFRFLCSVFLVLFNNLIFIFFVLFLLFFKFCLTFSFLWRSWLILCFLLFFFVFCLLRLFCLLFTYIDITRVPARTASPGWV